MKRIKVIALLFAAIMTVATVPAIAIAEQQAAHAPAVGAYRTPTINAPICIPTYPIRGQSFTVYGWLKWSGIPLAYRSVQVFYHLPGESIWHYWKNVPTDANGRFYFVGGSSIARAVYYAIRYPGDSVYYAVTTYRTVLIGYTYTRLYSTNYDPAPYGTFTLYGWVRNGYGQPGVNQRVNIYGRVYGSTTWRYMGYRYTSTTGYYSGRIYGAYGIVFYMAVFQGYPYTNNLYWSSQSNIVTIYA